LGKKIISAQFSDVRIEGFTTAGNINILTIIDMNLQYDPSKIANIYHNNMEI